VTGFCEHCNEPSISRKYGELVSYPKNC